MIPDFDSVGSGPLAVYGHGVFFSRVVVDRLRFPDLTPIPAAGLRLVRYDAAGHGRSPGKPDPDEYTFERHGANLLELLDHLGADTPVHGLGSSLGSAALLWAAVTEPDRFDRLVLFVPPRAWAQRPVSREMYESWAEQIDRDGPGPWRALLSGSAPPPVLTGLTGYPPNPDIADDLLPSVLRGVASSDLPSLSALSVLTQPTLILAWDTDPSHPLATAEQLGATLPNAQVEVARTLSEVRTWGTRAAQFLAGQNDTR